MGEEEHEEGVWAGFGVDKAVGAAGVVDGGVEFCFGHVGAVGLVVKRFCVCSWRAFRYLNCAFEVRWEDDGVGINSRHACSVIFDTSGRINVHEPVMSIKVLEAVFSRPPNQKRAANLSLEAFAGCLDERRSILIACSDEAHALHDWKREFRWVCGSSAPKQKLCMSDNLSTQEIDSYLKFMFTECGRCVSVVITVSLSNSLALSTTACLRGAA